MRVLSFCSGIGGLDLGVKLATRATTVGYVEGEAFCAAVLQARMGKGLDEAPIWSDVRTFDAAAWRGVVDCIIAGYPCQPFSHAGRRGGDQDPRHLWPHIARHIDKIRPAFVFCENVPGHLTLGFEQVCEDLSTMGYRIEAGIFSAEEIGAPHCRKRLFFLAYTDRGLASVLQCGARKKDYFSAIADGNGKDGTMAGCNAERPGAAKSRLRLADDGAAAELDKIAARGWPDDWEAGASRVTVDKEQRIERLRALGNAVIPAQAKLAWTTLISMACHSSSENVGTT